jgi:F-type H+-transporting ATPase subunit epsilon
MLIDVSILSPQEVIFEGKAKSVVLPGEQGVFEVRPFHKRLLGRLVTGTLLVDEKNFPIQRGIIKVEQNRVTIIIEQPV